MSAKSVLDVDVNAREFEKFMAAFDKYQDTLGEQPKEWQRAAEQQATLVKQFEKMNRGFTEQTDQLRAQEGGDKERLRRLSESEGLWSSMAKSSQSMAKNVLDIGSSLLKWGGYAAGAALFGSAWGIDRLAHNLGNTRSAGLGFGVSPSMLQAFNVNFSKVLDTQNFLASMTEMEGDVTKRRPWYSVMNGQSMSGDTSRDTLSFIEGLRNFAKQHQRDGLLGPLASAYQLPVDVETLNKFARTPDKEWQGMRANLLRDQQNFGMSDKGAKAWQDLSIQIERMSTLLKDKFAIALEPLVPKLIGLSRAVGDLITAFLKSPVVGHAIDDLAKWVGGLSKSMESQEFKQNAADMMDSVGTISTALKVLADILGVIGKAFSGWGHIYDLAKSAVGTLWQDATDTGQVLANLFRPDVNQQLAGLDQKAAVPAGTLEFLHANTPMAWQKSGVGPMGIPKSLGLPGADLGDLDTAGKMAALLYRKEMAKYSDQSKAMGALAMGDTQMDALLKSHPQDWQKFASPDIQQWLGKFASYQQSRASVPAPIAAQFDDLVRVHHDDWRRFVPNDMKKYADAYSAPESPGTQSAYVPQGSGVTVLVINATGANINTSLSQLGSR